MLPPFLTSSYKQCKADTDQIATYLANTANPSHSQPQKLSKNAKQRAKKRAKATAKEKGKQSALVPARLPDYVFAIDDFVPLAQKIRALKPPSVVPSAFINSLHRAIRLRKKVQRYLGQTNTSDEDHDGHQHFISVLEGVWKELEPLMPTAQEENLTDGGIKGKDAIRNAYANAFASLHLEEPSESFVNTPSVSRKAATVKEPVYPVDYEAECRKDLEEASVAFACLVDDFSDLRKFIWKMLDPPDSQWKDSSELAVMTNIALELARRLEEEIDPILSLHGGSEKMLHAYHDLKSYQNRESCEEPNLDVRAPDVDFKTYDVSSTYFWPIYVILRYYSSLERPGLPSTLEPVYNDSHVTSQKITRSHLPPETRHKQDKDILLGILPDFNILYLLRNIRLPNKP